MKKGVKALIFLLVINFGFTGLVQAQNDANDEQSQAAGPKYGTDSTNCVLNFSLYREFAKQKNYKDALPHWRWVFFNCPLASQNTYIDGARIMASMIDECKDPVLREKYIDSLMMVYDQRITFFGREGYVLGRKGIDLYTYRTDKVEQIYPVLKKAVEFSGNAAEGAVLVYYFRSILGMVDIGKLDKSTIVDGYDVVSEIIDHNLKAQKDDAKAFANWENVKGNIEATFEPFANCSELIGIYEKKYAENSDDIDLLIKITSVLERKRCTDSELFFSATEKLHKLQPSAQSAYLMGSLSLEKNNMSKAAEYMQQAANLYEDDADKIKALNVLANINFNQKNYTTARANAQRILQIDPNYGKAYILIGDLYASSSSMCNEDDMGGKTVFWAAVDKYVRARSVDPSVEAEANNKISQFSKHYPPASDLFFRDLTEGSPYTVGCWINENTTIRAAK